VSSRRQEAGNLTFAAVATFGRSQKSEWQAANGLITQRAFTRSIFGHGSPLFLEIKRAFSIA
jgi:hypothetical protein